MSIASPVLQVDSLPTEPHRIFFLVGSPQNLQEMSILCHILYQTKETSLSDFSIVCENELLLVPRF